MTRLSIAHNDPRAAYLAHRAEIDAAVRRVLESGRYVLGAEVAAFESEFASYLGARHAIGVASGTDALELALRACGIGAGKIVYAPSHTAVATIAAVECSGAEPVLVDVDPETFTLDPSRLDEAIRSCGRGRSGAIIAVHLYGQAADMPAILRIAKDAGLVVVEDCAQSHGATLQRRKTGTWGDVAAYSFFPTKNLGGLGDGGAVVTGNGEIAERVRSLRQYGWRGHRRESEIPGVNSRLDELHAAVLRARLPYLDRDNRRRQKLAARYDAGLGEVVMSPTRRDGAEHVFHKYVIRTAQRDAMQSSLESQGIATLVHYPQPVHLQPAYAGRVLHGGLAHSERAAQEVLSLPMYPELKDAEAERVIEAVRNFCRRGAGAPMQARRRTG